MDKLQDRSRDVGEPGTVMFVDDEQNILRAVVRSFRKDANRLITADSASHALEILAASPVDILISDYRMPGTDGLSLLRSVKESYPNVHRIVLSGYIDEPEIFRAVGTGLATSFFVKPWEDGQLKGKIHHVLRMRERLSERHLLELVNTVDHLPTLPPLYLDLTQAVEEDRSVDEIVAIIGKDPSATSAVLHMANSAFYGVGSTRSVATLKDAVLNLGLMHIKDMVLALSLIKARRWTPEELHHIIGIFIHSLLLESFAPMFHERLHGRPLPRHCYSAAIVHDIGKIILLEYYPERFRQVMNRMHAAPGLSFYDAELALGLAGQTHCEIGAYFLDWWNMPDALTEAALYHHSPEQATSDPEVACTIAYLNRLLNAVEGTVHDASVDMSSFIEKGISADFLAEFRENAILLIAENKASYEQWLDPRN